MTGYLSAEGLAEVVRRGDSLPGALDLLDALSSWTSELIPVSKVRPREMLSTYEIRLASSQSGEGPRVIGLEAFVEVLRSTDSDIGGFSIHTPSANFVGLLNETGSTLLALTMIFRPDDY